jgi:hypothetical protein
MADHPREIPFDDYESNLDQETPIEFEAKLSVDITGDNKERVIEARKQLAQFLLYEIGHEDLDLHDVMITVYDAGEAEYPVEE